MCSIRRHFTLSICQLPWSQWPCCHLPYCQLPWSQWPCCQLPYCHLPYCQLPWSQLLSTWLVDFIGKKQTEKTAKVQFKNFGLC